MSGFPIIFGGGIDPDASQYFNRAGVSSTAVTPSSFQNASSFNGTTQYLSASDTDDNRLNGTDFTVSAWVNPSSVTANHTIMGKPRTGGADYLFQVSTSFGVRLSYNVSGTWYTGTAVNLSLNTWSFVTFVLSGSVVTTYINGVPLATYTLPVPIITTVGSTFGVGGSGASEYFAGSLSSIGIWKRALSGSEITFLYNSGFGRTYASLDASIKTNLVSWWDLSETSGNRLDSFGSNTLTNNNSVGTTRGPIVTSTATSRVLLLDFIKGIKNLGLWNTFVCWPLRRGQNASTTLTAQSLGGLGTYNATLTNGGVGSWGLNGITASGTAGSYLFVPSYPVITTPHSLFGVHTVSTSGIAGGFANIIHAGGPQGASSVGRLNLFGFSTASFLITGSSLRFLTGGNNQRAVPDSNRNMNTPYFRAGSYNTDLTSISHIIDGTVISDGAPTSGTGNLPFTDSNTGLSLLATQLNGVINTSPFVGLCTGYLTSAQHNSIRALYKSTLGLGLGLA
jgi:hypothetical protein